MGPRNGPDVLGGEKNKLVLPEFEFRTVQHVAKLPYRRCPGSHVIIIIIIIIIIGKGKAIPLQAWTGPESSRSLRLQDNRHMKVVRLSALSTGRLYHPGNIPGTHFC